MPSSSRSYLKWKYVSFGLFRVYKQLYQQLLLERQEPKKVLLILGCQRSGTSLMYWILERDLYTKIYRESSELSSGDKEKRLRLNSLDTVQAQINKQKPGLIALKPLVESQRTLTLLQEIENSKALWMYRHYKDVASSNLKAFGRRNGIDDLRPIVENQPHNWRSENVSDYTRSIIADHFSEEMNPYDAAALFWFARNRLFLELALDKNPDVMLCRYDDLVTHPAETMGKIYRFMDFPYPGDHIARDVHARSVGKGSDVTLSPPVDQLCKELMAELDAREKTTAPVFQAPMVTR